MGKITGMKVISSKADIEGFLKRLRKRYIGSDPDITERVSAIVKRVRKGGDKALLGYTERFDGHSSITITPADIKAHARKADPKVIKALRLSAGRIRKFHKHQREASWSFSEPGGIRLGQILRPLDRVGVYVPGGMASYPSTVLMNVIPAQVAGVPDIAIAVPTPRGEINPAVMAAIEIVGIKEVWTAGGAQAVAALAYGTESIRRVDKIVGPGNVYVATAKKMVFGDVDIDMVAGPSEILVIADDTAHADFIAADMLSQAEHDPLASSVLITNSERLALAVQGELKRQCAGLHRRETAERSLRDYGAIILVRSLEDAAGISNTIAPEHLEIMCKASDKLIPKLRNAGAIFVGDWTPEPLGDYSAGPNHTLPTVGTARFSSPLGVYDFIKRTSLIQFGREGFNRLAPTVECIAEAEGLDAHANAVRIRRGRGKSKHV